MKIIREKYPDLKILMQTIFEENEKIFTSILAGANGYILKTRLPPKSSMLSEEIFEGGAPMSHSIATNV